MLYRIDLRYQIALLFLPIVACSPTDDGTSGIGGSKSQVESQVGGSPATGAGGEGEGAGTTGESAAGGERAGGESSVGGANTGGVQTAGGAEGTPTGGFGGKEQVELGEGEFVIDIISLPLRTLPVVLTAHWSPEIDRSADPLCDVRKSGGCMAYRCTSVLESDLESPPAVGSIYVTMNGVKGPLTAEAVTNGYGEYTNVEFSPLDATLIGEETGTVVVEGGDIPGFEMDVVLPLFLISTSDDLVEDRIFASRTEDILLAWERGTEGVEYIVQTRFIPVAEGERINLACAFDSTLGEGVIDAHLLELVPAGSLLDTYMTASKIVEDPAGRVVVRTASATINPEKNAVVDILVGD